MCKISIYMDTGNVYEYTVSDYIKGREHAAAIINTGYRASDIDDLVWYPPHRILKVIVEGGAKSTNYRNETRAT